MALIKHPNWYKFLRNTFKCDNNQHSTPFRELIKKMPGKASAEWTLYISIIHHNTYIIS